MHCPVCDSDMRNRSLLSHYSLKPYRVCPYCKTKYTTDPKTRRRQIPIVILALISLGLTFVVHLKELGWLLPGVLSFFIYQDVCLINNAMRI